MRMQFKTMMWIILFTIRSRISSVQRKDHQERYYPHMSKCISIHILCSFSLILESLKITYTTLTCVKKVCKSEVANNLMHNSLLKVTLLSSASSAVDLVGRELWTLWLECSLEQRQLVPLGQPAIYNKPELISLMYL